MERNNTLLWVLFAWIEPLVIGIINGRQWLILLALCNICIILLWNAASGQQKNSSLPQQIFSYKSQLHNLRTQNNYFWAISFLWFIWGLIAYILHNGEQFDKIAFWLIIAWVVYWVISAVTHGFKTTRTNVASKLFLWLIVVWAWWWVLWSSNGYEFISSIPAKLQDIFTIPKAAAPTIQQPVDQTTWTEQATSGNDQTTVQEAVKTEEQPIENNTQKDTTTPLTFAQVVPALVKAYALKVPAGSVSFTNISSTSPLYNDFKAGGACCR
jgi:hypothetical protein